MPSQVNINRPKAIVFDILGTASKSGFLEKILFPFLKQNLEPYLNSNWNKSDFKKLYARIAEQASELNRQDPQVPLVANYELPDARSTLLAFLNYVTDNAIQSAPVTQLRFKVWFEGYQRSQIRTPIYSDVPNKMRRWYAEGIKFYVYSNTWVAAQKALLQNTNHGDLTNLISGYYDNDFGPLNDADSWRRLCNEIRENPNDVLFLTKSVPEGRAAQEAGLSVCLVLTHRHNVKAVSREDRQRFPYVRTLNELLWVQGGSSIQPSRAASNQAAANQAEPSTNQALPLASVTRTGPPLASTSRPASSRVSGTRPSAVGRSQVANSSASRSQAPSSSASRSQAPCSSASRSQAPGSSSGSRSQEPASSMNPSSAASRSRQPSNSADVISDRAERSQSAHSATNNDDNKNSTTSGKDPAA